MKYIFITCDVHVIGGMQQYIAGKVDYLEERGWEVYILYQGEPKGNCLIDRFNDYVIGGFLELFYAPHCYPKFWVHRTINKMVKYIGKNHSDEEIIIESHNSQTSLWGEILASRLKAKHFCFECVEKFRSPSSYFSEYLHFFKFKYDRFELAGINENSLKLLFEAYPIKLRHDDWVFFAAVRPAVQDVTFNFKAHILKSDWTICYIGRTEKDYFPIIITDLDKFAKNHRDKRIQFIIVGNTDNTDDLINKVLNADNVNIIRCGDMVPIPRELFKYVDVVIAGAGCAFAAKNEHVFTIVADSQTNLSGGVWWFDTTNILHQSDYHKQEHFDVTLERVLVSKTYSLEDWIEPLEKHPNDYYAEHFDFINRYNRKIEYYPEDDLIRGNSMSFKVFKFYIAKKFPFISQIWISLKHKFINRH